MHTGMGTISITELTFNSKHLTRKLYFLRFIMFKLNGLVKTRLAVLSCQMNELYRRNVMMHTESVNRPIVKFSKRAGKLCIDRSNIDKIAI